MDAVRKPLGRLFLLVVLLSVAAAAQAAQIKIATVAPEGSQWMQDMRAAAAEIRQRTAGRVVVKFYAGGVMGNDRKVLRKMRIGQLQGGTFTATGLAERYPDIVLYGLPLLFESQQEVDYVRQRMDATLERGLREAGLVCFGFAGGGFAKLMANQPVVRTEDLQGQKVWVPKGDPVSLQGLKALNLLPVVLPITDVLTGLQTGLLDAVVASPVGAVVLQWYTRVSYVTDQPVAYTMGLMVVDERAFNRLSPEDQAVFSEVMKRVYADFDHRNRRENEEAEQALRDNGLKFVDLDRTEIDRWRRVADETNHRMSASGLFSAALLHELQGYLGEYRTAAARQVASAAESE